MAKKNEDIIIDVMKTGEIRIRRGNKKQNEGILSILKEMIGDPIKIKKIEKFLNETDEIEVLLGDEILCG